MQLRCHEPFREDAMCFKYLGCRISGWTRGLMTGRGPGSSTLGSAALAVLLELVSELPETDAQELGGSGLHAARTGQGHLEISPLDLVQHRLQVDPVGRDLNGDLLRVPRDMEVGGKRLGFQDLPATEDESPLDDVLELPD